MSETNASQPPDKMDELISEWEKRRYVPKPGEPDLPPQLSEFTNKTTDEVIQEINRLPFFMTELDETDGDGGENANLEALKSLAYDGEPDEIATNFKNQGNECYKAKKYKDAIKFYTQGLEIEHGVDSLNAALYSNRAACNLELKNYRSCIEDCKKVLLLDEKNIKAIFRSGKALFAVERYDEAKEILKYGLTVDGQNKQMQDLLAQVLSKENKVKLAKQAREREQELAEMRKSILSNAIKLRHIEIIKTVNPPEMLEQADIKLEDDKDFESQLIFPAFVMYPTVDELDFVAQVSELTTPEELIGVVMNKPNEWYEKPGHENLLPKNLQCFMETVSGGLVKVGKKAHINGALMSDKAKAPLFDNSLRVYLVPKQESQEWVSTWNKEVQLAKRCL